MYKEMNAYINLLEDAENMKTKWNENLRTKHIVDNQEKIDELFTLLIDKVKKVDETSFHNLRDTYIPRMIALIGYYEKEEDETEEEYKLSFNRQYKFLNKKLNLQGGRRKTRRHRHKKSSPKRKSIHRRKTRSRRHRKTRQRK